MTYSEEALKDRQFRNWFEKFRSGDFSLKDEERSGRPSEVDDDQIRAIKGLYQCESLKFKWFLGIF